MVARDQVIGILKKGWCKGELAKDKDGKTCPWASPEATKFCLLGAIYKSGHKFSSDGSVLIRKIYDKLGVVSTMSSFNDGCGSVEDVVKMLESL